MANFGKARRIVDSAPVLADKEGTTQNETPNVTPVQPERAFAGRGQSEARLGLSTEEKEAMKKEIVASLKAQVEETLKSQYGGTPAEVKERTAKLEAAKAEAEKGKAEAEAKATKDKDETRANLMKEIQGLKNEQTRTSEQNKIALQELENEKIELNNQLEQARGATAEAVAKAKSEVTVQADPALQKRVEDLEDLMKEAGPLLAYVEQLSENDEFRKLVSLARDLLTFHENTDKASLNSKVQYLLESDVEDHMEGLKLLAAEFGEAKVKEAVEESTLEPNDTMAKKVRKTARKMVENWPTGLASELEAAKAQVEEALGKDNYMVEVADLSERLGEDLVESLLKSIEKEDGALAERATEVLKAVVTM